MKKIIFIVNPISGTNSNLNFEKLIGQHLDSTKFDSRVEYISKKRSAKHIAREAIGEGLEIVVIVGGDGSVNLVAQALVGTNIILGIIPSGSGNGLARHLGIPMRMVAAIDVINKGTVKPIDTGTVNSKLFVSICGTGFDALIAKKFAKIKRRGFFSYLQLITENYLQYKPRKYRIMFGGDRLTTKALLVCCANSGQFGYNTVIAPQARIDDGLLDVAIVRKVPLLQTSLIMPFLFTRKIDRSPYVNIVRTNQLTIKRKRNKVVNIDGDPQKVGKNLHIKINKQSLNVIVPKQVNES